MLDNDTFAPKVPHIFQIHQKKTPQNAFLCYKMPNFVPQMQERVKEFFENYDK